MIEKRAMVMANPETAGQHCISSMLPNLKQLTPADKLQLAAKLEHLAAVLRVCASCALNGCLREESHCPLIHPPRRN